MEVSNGTAAGKTEAARKSTDKTGAATASADRRAAEADADTARGEPAPSHRGGPCHLIWYHAPRSSRRVVSARRWPPAGRRQTMVVASSPSPAGAWANHMFLQRGDGGRLPASVTLRPLATFGASGGGRPAFLW